MTTTDRIAALAAKIDDACEQMELWLQTRPKWPAPPISGSVTALSAPSSSQKPTARFI